jgi:hypothetical protein
VQVHLPISSLLNLQYEIIEYDFSVYVEYLLEKDSTFTEILACLNSLAQTLVTLPVGFLTFGRTVVDADAFDAAFWEDRRIFAALTSSL